MRGYKKKIVFPQCKLNYQKSCFDQIKFDNYVDNIEDKFGQRIF